MTSALDRDLFTKFLYDQLNRLLQATAPSSNSTGSYTVSWSASAERRVSSCRSA